MTSTSKSVCDPKNYEQLFNTHSTTVFNFIYYKCGDRQQAEDIVQDAFIKLWRNCSKVDFEKAKSYVFTVARNLFFNEAAHKKIVLKYQSNPNSSINNQTPEFILEEQQFMEKLNEAIAGLPEKQREVFLLSRIDKKKYSEISEIVGISIKAVEKRMSLALIALRDKLGNI
ncbi:RNA polymerase sigma factor [Aestuariivivens sediminis]|uniref:RNA polymerase sigma factor n=1 Tax=Aestuariivivens sediminis TaxID=2913557 RepID=UPI001F59544A|nr:sigma-70 family RNA polymerase sigma factor [Aestuariivivens sediminis]